jgi:hypothetical protein
MGMAYILPRMRSAVGNVRQSFEIDRSRPVIHVALEYKFGPVAAGHPPFEVPLERLGVRIRLAKCREVREDNMLTLRCHINFMITGGTGSAVLALQHSLNGSISQTGAGTNMDPAGFHLFRSLRQPGCCRARWVGSARLK